MQTILADHATRQRIDELVELNTPLLVFSKVNATYSHNDWCVAI